MARDDGLTSAEPPAPVPATGVFVGRERELTELRAGLNDAFAGRGRLFLIVGEPGIGKTRLADELGTDAARRGAHVIWGRCWEDGSAPAYWPWIQVIRALLRAAEASTLAAEIGSGAAYIAQIVPAVADLPGVQITAAPAVIASEQARFSLFDAITAFLVKAAARRPLLLVLDDLHAGDPPSLLLLQFLARELREAHVLVIGTCRGVELERQTEPARILSGAARHGHRIPLSGWSEAEVARFIERTLTPRPAHAPPPALAATVYRVTEGNPFFVDEVMRFLVSEGRLDLADERAVQALPIPHGIREAVRGRLRPLSDECRHTVATAAIIGREFDLACLREVLSTGTSHPSTDELLDLLTEAAGGGIVTRLAGVVGRYTFHHALIRETLYDDTPPAQRMRMHQRIGDVLESLYAGNLEPPRLAELAHHFFEALPAGAISKAVAYATRAGERAARQLAYEEAAAHYERALQALAGEPDDARQCELLLALGNAQARTASAKARDTFRRAAALARRLGASLQLAHAALGFADLGLGVPHGSPDAPVVALLEEALRALGEPDSALHVRLLARLAAEVSVSDDRERGVALSEEAVAMARRLGDTMTLTNALSARHFVLWRANFIGDRMSIASEVVRLADGAGDKELAIQGRTWRLLDLMGIGDFHAFDAEMRVYARAAAALHQPRYAWLALNFRAMRELWRGRFAEAESFAQEALGLGQRSDDETTRINPWVQIFVIRREQARLDQQEMMTRFAAEQYPTSPVPRTFLALLYCELGREAEARVEFERVAVEDFEDLRRERRVGVLPYLSEVCHRLGDARRAARLYELLLPHAQSNVPYGASLCFGAAAHYLALLTTTMSRCDEAQRFFEDALTRHERMEGWPWLARTQYEYARMLVGAGAPAPDADSAAKAQRLLDAALDTARRLGMAALAEDIRALQRPEDEPVSTSLPAEAAIEPAEPALQQRSASGGSRGATVLRFPNRRSRKPPAEMHSATSERSEPSDASSQRPAGTPQHGVFRRDGEYWTIGDATTVVRLKDTKGLRYLAQLLRHPGREFHATDLAATEACPRDAGAPLNGATNDQLRRLGLRTASAAEPGEPLLDAQARSAYKRRLEDLRDQLDEATRFNDVERAARAQEEIDFLTHELARAVGLRGRGRTASSHAERARLNVTRAIKAVLKRIAAGNPQLGRFLSTTIKTGAFCSYTPDPRFPTTWKLE